MSGADGLVVLALAAVAMAAMAGVLAWERTRTRRAARAQVAAPLAASGDTATERSRA